MTPSDEEAKSDEALMSEYAAGDRRAFDLLFSRYAARLYHVMVRGLRRSEDARDLVQKTFLQVHRHRADYDARRAFRPWIYTIALNLKRQYLRSAARRPESELDDMVERTLADVAGPASLENRQLLDLALRRIRPEAAEVVVLHWFGEMSMQDIATMLGISESAVKVRAHRAYESLRDVLREERVAAEAATGPASRRNPSSENGDEPGNPPGRAAYEKE